MNYADTHLEIIEGCKRGNRQAQSELYHLYSQAMYNICLRMVKNQSDAEDLLQNSFVDVFTKLDSFKQESSIGAWIKRVVINNCINFLKKRRLQFEEFQDHYTDTLVDTKEEVPDISLNVHSINAALQELPDGYRVVFTLYLFEGYDHREIAEILNISEATSKSQYSRARKKIKGILGTS